MRKKWTIEEDDIIRSNYGKIPTRQIVPMLPDRTYENIYKRASKLKLKALKISRRFKVNDNFFSDVNSISCYYAGFIAADGNIRKSSPVLTVTQKDIKVLEKFKNIIGFHGAIYKNNSKNSFGGIHHSLSICSKQIVKDLEENFNITPAKTYTLKPPSKLSRYYNLCYLIGLIDGDGCIGVYKNKKSITPYIRFSLCGSKYIVHWIKDLLGIGITFNKKTDHPSIKHYSCSGSNILKTLISLLEINELSDIRFERKWNFLEKLTPLRAKKRRVKNDENGKSVWV